MRAAATTHVSRPSPGPRRIHTWPAAGGRSRAGDTAAPRDASGTRLAPHHAGSGRRDCKDIDFFSLDGCFRRPLN